jgi:hypothetical protein
VVTLVGDQVLVASPADVGKVVTVAADGSLVFAEGGGDAQGDPDKGDIDILVAGLARTGVVSGCAVTAQGVPDMTLAVAAGTVIFGTAFASVTAGNVTVSAADATNPRFDLVVVDTTGAKSVVAGIAAASPAFPTIPANRVVLAAVYVPAADTAIAANQIVDKRVLVQLPPLLLLGETVLGAANPTIEVGPFSTLFRELLIQGRVRSSSAGTDGLLLQVGGAASIDTTSGNYHWDNYGLGDSNTEAAGFTAQTSIALGAASVVGANGAAGKWSTMEVTFFDYADTTYYRGMQGRVGMYTTSGTRRKFIAHGDWLNTADAISRVRLSLVTGPNFIAGSKLRVYGIA